MSAGRTEQGLRNKAVLILAGIVALSPYLAMASWLVVRGQWTQAAGYLLASGLVIAVLAKFVHRLRPFLLWHYPLFLSATVFAVVTLSTRETPSYPLAYLLMTTTWEELRGLLGLWQWQKWLWLWLCVMAIYLILALATPGTARWPGLSPAARRIAMGAGALLFAGMIWDGAAFIKGAFSSPLIGPVQFAAVPMVSAADTIRGTIRDSVSKRPFNATRKQRNEVHVLIIGESERRDSWQLYGYERPTTPYLFSIRSELFVFGHASSDANLTMYAVPMLLTGLPPEDFDFHAMHGSIADLAEEAGYSTAWLVNQDPGPTISVGIQTDYLHIPRPKRTGPKWVTFPPDEVLLPFLDEALKKRAPLVVGMHVYGSHYPYASRYPKQFARFETVGPSVTDSSSRDRQLVDRYDNSVLYSDWLIGQVIERIRSLNVPATVTFVSDHGEDLMAFDGDAGHGKAAYSEHAFAIPAFVWASPAYRAAHADMLMALDHNLAKPIHSHEFIYLLADLMDIRWPGYVSAHSIASPDYVPESVEQVLAGGTLIGPIVSTGSPSNLR